MAATAKEEERGRTVRSEFWKCAHTAKIEAQLKKIHEIREKRSVEKQTNCPLVVLVMTGAFNPVHKLSFACILVFKKCL